MIFSEENYKYMFQALLLAEQALHEDEVPIGAVVVKNGLIIGRGYNQVERLHDTTAHAEIIAITAAMNHLKDKFLTDCDLYVTIEPCLMCAGAIKLARIKNLYVGAPEPKFGACGSIYNVIEDDKYNHKVNLYSGIYEEESKKLMQEFFNKKRNFVTTL
jgi:tRNA(adenine34) deaminase